jgi:hypothetical protein
MVRPSLFVRPLEQGEVELPAHLRKSHRQALRQCAEILMAPMVLHARVPDRAHPQTTRRTRVMVPADNERQLELLVEIAATWNRSKR